MDSVRPRSRHVCVNNGTRRCYGACGRLGDAARAENQDPHVDMQLGPIRVSHRGRFRALMDNPTVPERAPTRRTAEGVRHRAPGCRRIRDTTQAVVFGVSPSRGAQGGG